jgi:hypothetical protein
MTERQVQGAPTEPGAATAPPHDWEPVPGLLPRWDIPKVVHPGVEFYLQESGILNGVELFKVFRRRLPTAGDGLGLAVELSFDGEPVPVAARLLPVDEDDPTVAALIIEPNQHDAVARMRARMGRAAPAQLALFGGGPP